MPIKISNELKNQFNSLIDDRSTSENELQLFFEKNPEILPILNTQGHGLHLSSVITKLPLGLKYKTDFVYLNKDSAEWRVCFIEIEKATKEIFKKDGDFTVDFNQAYEQIESWHNWLKLNESEKFVRKSLKNIMVPLGMRDNPISFHYILVIGKKDGSWTQEQLTKWNNRKKNNIQLFTYDQVLRYKENDQRFNSSEIHVIRINDEDKIAFDNLIVNRFFKDFNILNPSSLSLTNQQKDSLHKQFNGKFEEYQKRSF